MTTVRFTQNLRRHVECEDRDLDGPRTVREALDAYFADAPSVRGYVLEDDGSVRHHVVIFVNGTAITDREAQSDPVDQRAEILVMQALSGG